MPIYMDRHNTEGLTREDIVASHVKDLAIQGQYGVRFITYWHDEVTSKAFCLVDAPNRDALQKVQAHKGVANEIIEVDPAVVEAFLGRVTDPPPIDSGGPGLVDSASRAIMFTDLQDYDRPTSRREGYRIVADTRFFNPKGVARIHRARSQTLRRWNHGLVCFYRSILDCAIAIQRALAAHNVQNSDAPLHLRIGLSVGEPVEHDNDCLENGPIGFPTLHARETGSDPRN